MKVKCVIYKKDHNNETVVERKRFRPNRAGDVINHGSRAFILDNQNFQITFRRVLLFWKVRYITYYYRPGKSTPVPIHTAKDKEVSEHAYSDRDISEIFDPWALGQLGRPQSPKLEHVKFMLLIGIALGVVYLAYTLSGMQDAIIEGVKACMADPTCGVEPTPPAGGANTGTTYTVEGG